MAVRAAAGTGYLSKTPSGFSSHPWSGVFWARTQNDESEFFNPLVLGNSDLSTVNYSAIEAAGVIEAGDFGGFATESAVAAANTWMPFAFTRTGSILRLWRLDTRLAASYSSAGANTVQLLLAFGGPTFSLATRDLRGLKIWSALLTDAELMAEAQQFAPIRTTDLRHYAPLAAHTDLSDAVAGGSWTPVESPSLSTVADPSNVPEEWDGPKVASVATTTGTTSSGGLSCNLPSGIEAGDLLLAHAANDTSVSWSASAGWELIDNGANGSAVQGATWARIATGSDALTITGEANDIAVVVSRIVNHGVSDVSTDIVKGTAATGSSNAPNGPNCNPGTSGKYLWITHYAADDDDNTALWWPAEGAPVAQIKSTTGSSSCMTGVAYRWLEASSYDPSAFALAATEEWRAQTFAIPPAGGAGPVTGSFAVTESGVDTAAFAGDVLIYGALAATESGSDTAAITGVAQTPITGTLEAAESGGDTAALAGEALVSGALAASEFGSDVAAFAGDVFVAGSIAANESGADTAALSGAVPISGTFAATETGSDTALFSGAGVVIASGSLAANESGADTADFAGLVLISGSLDATESGADTASFSGPIATGGVTPAGRSRGKRRRVVIRERVYEVNERDIPALLEAELLDRAPPVTAEVIEGPKPPRKRARKRARKAPQPVKTVAEVREAVQQIKRRIEPDNAWLAQALETVAFRVLERLQDEEDSLMLLLAA